MAAPTRLLGPLGLTEPGGPTEEGWEEPGLGFGAPAAPAMATSVTPEKAPAPEAAGSPPCVPPASQALFLPFLPLLLSCLGGCPQRGWRRRGSMCVCLYD